MPSLCLVLLLLPVLASATRVQATLDRDSAQLGDTVTLNLRVSDTLHGKPRQSLAVLIGKKRRNRPLHNQSFAAEYMHSIVTQRRDASLKLDANQ